MYQLIRLRRLLVAAFVGGLVVAAAPLPAGAAPAGPVDPDGLGRALSVAVDAQAGPLARAADQRISHYVMRTDRSGRWAFGSVVRMEVGEEAPQGWLYIARHIRDTWKVGLAHTRALTEVSDGAPVGVLTPVERGLLAPKGTARAAGPGILAAPNDPYTGLMLPWEVGQSWTLTSGPHGSHGSPTRTAVDLADLAGGGGRVRSAGGGFGFAMCPKPGNPGWVRVYHPSGFSTDYYHLANNVKPGGAWLPRGTHLGNTSNDVSCGGTSTGPHLHFSIYWGDTALPIDNKTFGGWTFFAGTNERDGFARHGGRVAQVGDPMLNFGVVEAAATSPRSDFNGDGRADIATFTKGRDNDVYVALSNGAGFAGTAALWHGGFGFLDEVILTGDVNGDNRDDLVSFARSWGEVFVALSTGSSFGTRTSWRQSFASGNSIPAVGDFNGDGRDDIAMFTRGTTADVNVALSNGFAFNPPTLWHSFFAARDEFPAIGDVDGDNRDDIITFTRDGTADVHVARSNGKAFMSATKWHDAFAFDDELPAIGDVNGDNRDDIITFTRGQLADVFVATSTGAAFAGIGVKWHDSFAPSTNIPGVGDVDRDGRADLIAYTRGGEADVFVARSFGWAFGDSAKWHDAFAFGDETPRPSSL